MGGVSEVLQRLSLAQHHWRLDQNEQAQRVLDDLGDRAFEHVDYWLLRAGVRQDLKDLEGAASALAAGLSRFPESVALLGMLGRVRCAQDDLVGAEEAYLSALSLRPEWPTGLCGYARVVAKAGQEEKARRLLERAASLTPEAEAVWAARYDVARLLGNNDEARALAQEIAVRTGGRPDTLALVGFEALREGKIGEAGAWVERAIDGDGGTVDLLGADNLRELQTLRHPLVAWAAWPLLRFGVGPFLALGILLLGGLSLLGYQAVGRWVAVLLFGWLIYAIAVPPLVRRWLER